MGVNRDSRGRYVSDNSDPMTKMMIEKYQNSRGMRILRGLIEADMQQRAQKNRGEE